MENFLRKHFNPVWASFNRSLQNLSNMVRNLSHDVEANKKSIERFQESTVPKKEFQELGTKFESKVQENVVKVRKMGQGGGKGNPALAAPRPAAGSGRAGLGRWVARGLRRSSPAPAPCAQVQGMFH